jgi:hypothetical protein
MKLKILWKFINFFSVFYVNNLLCFLRNLFNLYYYYNYDIIINHIINKLNIKLFLFFIYIKKL